MFKKEEKEEKEVCPGCGRDFVPDKEKCEDCYHYTVCSHYKCNYCLHCKEYKDR